MSSKAVRTFASGAIRDVDNNKEDYIETISWRALRRFAEYMTGKKAKYGVGNFKKGIPIKSYEESLLRHINKYLEVKYENGQVERDQDHLAAMIFNIFGIMHEENLGENGWQPELKSKLKTVKKKKSSSSTRTSGPSILPTPTKGNG